MPIRGSKTTMVSARECHGFLKPAGFAMGFSGVRVRVGNSVPPKNPYPWHGFWVTRAMTRHMLGHQPRRRQLELQLQTATTAAAAANSDDKDQE